jgi:hypothetical protein
MPESPISVAPKQEATATAASIALPPSINVRNPATDANGCADDTIPRRPVTAGRYCTPPYAKPIFYSPYSLIQ